jgi:O-methyltransferase
VDRERGQDGYVRKEDNPYPGWGQGLRQNAFTLANKAWRGARLNRAVDGVLSYLPPPAKRWVDGRRTALRVWAGWEVLPPEEVARAFRECLALLERRMGRDRTGDYVEFGVFYGTSLLTMQQVSADAGLSGIRLFGFDSFEGLPEGAEAESEGIWRAGEFHASLRGARRHMTARGADWDRITLVPGWFDDTLTPATAERLGLEKASVIMVDCDLYSSAVACLSFAEPLIRDEAVLVFDDWHTGGLASRNEGERRAFDELLARTPDLEVVGELEPYSDTSAIFHVRRHPA